MVSVDKPLNAPYPCTRAVCHVEENDLLCFLGCWASVTQSVLLLGDWSSFKFSNKVICIFTFHLSAFLPDIRSQFLNRIILEIFYFFFHIFLFLYEIKYNIKECDGVWISLSLDFYKKLEILIRVDQSLKYFLSFLVLFKYFSFETCHNFRG